MVYHVKCIIPHDRYCHFNGYEFITTNPDECDEENAEIARLESTKFTFIDQDGTSRVLSLLELSNTLRFAYTTHLSFMEERDFRIMPVTWGLTNFSDDTMTAISPTAHQLGIVDELERGELCSEMYIKYIDPTLGYGLFSSTSLRCDTFIGEYVGIVLCTQQPGEYSLNFPCLDGGHEINAQDTGNLVRFINHSRTPNASFQNVYHEGVIHTVVRMVLEVQGDTQITVNYGVGYWIGRGVSPAEL